VDLNEDGHRDILSGSYSRMEDSMAGLFQVLWGQPGGGFKQAAVLNGTDKKPLIIPIKNKEEQTQNICTRPTAVDWNGDGKLDLVVGNFAGSFYLFEGRGGGKFDPTPQPLLCGKARLSVEGAHSDPFVVDWDGDGDLDLLSGSNSGGVQWAENRAGKGKVPELKNFIWLIRPGPGIKPNQIVNEDDLTGPAGSTRVYADDVDGDGKLDLLVGDAITLVSLVKGVSADQYKIRLSEWEKEFNEAMRTRDTASNDKERAAAQKKYQALYKQREEFMKEERTGYVWLYRQK
jgi:hypothetical protein